MAKKRSLLIDYTVYLVVRVVVAVVQALSWPLALKLARGLGWLAHRLDRRHREVAAENLRYAFPDLDEAGIARLVRATYEHFATVLIEMIRIPRTLTQRTASRYVLYANPGDYERVIAWTECGRPLMILLGHFGNWEILSYLFGLLGHRAGVIARRLDNPYLDHLVCVLREKTGQTILDKNRDQETILDPFKHYTRLAMLGDQDAGANGLFVDFLGRPASTFKSIALLSLEYAAPILVFGAARVGHPMKYRLYIEDVILPEEYAEQKDALRAITQRYTRALERMIRRHPEQYFWLHRRWKHQPKARGAKKAA